MVVHSGSTWMDPSPMVATMWGLVFILVGSPHGRSGWIMMASKKVRSWSFFLPCLLLSYYWSMRIGFATREKQPMANPTVKLLFLHSGCCFEVVRTPPWQWPRHQQLHPGSWSAEAPQIWLPESWMHATMRNWAWFMGRGRMESYIYIYLFIYLYYIFIFR